MSTEFYVGQQVVCVDDENSDKFTSKRFLGIGDMGGLTKGRIYTIRGVVRDYPRCTVRLSLYLEEIIRPLLGSDECECPFAAVRFRPVTKTDISIFTAMLQPSPKTVNA